MRNLALLCCFFALVILPLGVSGQSADERYIQVYEAIQEGEALRRAGETGAALDTLQRARNSLLQLQTSHPSWNQSVVQYRLKFLSDRIETLRGNLDSLAQPAAEEATPSDMTPAEALAELRSMRQNVERLESEREILEAKLREALSAQPAALDPRELEKAESMIESLEKENGLLKVALEQKEQELKDSGNNAEAVNQLRQRLEEAESALGAQEEVAAALRQEREILLGRLRNQKGELAAELSVENENLRSRVNLLELRLADANRRATNGAGQNTIDRELMLDRAALEVRLATIDVEDATDATDTAAESSRIRQLENERDELRRNLELAKRELKAARGTEPVTRLEEMAEEIALLRARLEVFEARPVPYTAEEIALRRKGEQDLLDGAGSAALAAGRTLELPTGTGHRVEEARRDLSAGRFEAAEKQLLEVLQQDEDNVLILIDLAYSQAEQGRVADAEINLRRALAGAPQHSQALYLLGYVKYRQDEFDAAFDALSRAAQIDPGNARVQNLLGGTLMEKGQRAAAETAFRNAIRLQPGFAGPHYNLAFLYIKQDPPFVELARWHYEKAMDAGHPRVPDLEREIREAASQEVSAGP